MCWRPCQKDDKLDPSPVIWTILASAEMNGSKVTFCKVKTIRQGLCYNFDEGDSVLGILGKVIAAPPDAFPKLIALIIWLLCCSSVVVLLYYGC